MVSNLAIPLWPENNIVRNSITEAPIQLSYLQRNFWLGVSVRTVRSSTPVQPPPGMYAVVLHMYAVPCVIPNVQSSSYRVSRISIVEILLIHDDHNCALLASIHPVQAKEFFSKVFFVRVVLSCGLLKTPCAADNNP